MLSLSTLPDEMVEEIMRHLEATDLCAVLAVNHAWHRFASAMGDAWRTQAIALFPALPRPHRPAGPIRIATDLFLTPSTLQLLLTFVVADDRCPCGSRGLHQAELLELLEGWPERMAWM